jgi:hypothetical protein
MAGVKLRICKKKSNGAFFLSSVEDTDQNRFVDEGRMYNGIIKELEVHQKRKTIETMKIWTNL